MAQPKSSVLPALAIAAAAAGGVAVAVTVAKSKQSDFYPVVVFLDSAQKGCSLNGKYIRHCKDASLLALQAAVSSSFSLSTPPRLFLWDTKEELQPSNLQDQLTSYTNGSAAWSQNHIIVIIATTEEGLSKQAANLPAIQLPPIGPRPLPIIGNAYLASGPYVKGSMYNFHHNLFRPELIKRWGETVALVMPYNPVDQASLSGHVDDPSVLSTNIQTCDADVVAELLARQEDFPKCWNRAQEKTFSQLGSGGIFTSPTESEDWQTAHGIFPKAFNPLKVSQSYHPIIAKKTEALVSEWARFAPGHLVTEVNNWLACFTADAVIQASCNLNMDNIARKARGEPVHRILDLYRRMTSMSPLVSAPWEVVGLWQYLNPLVNSSAVMMRRYQAMRTELMGLVDDLMDQARRGNMSGTLLSALVNESSPTNGQFIKQRNMFGHFVTLLVAGHETTANTMGFLMYYLSQNPEWEDRIRREIREVLGGRDQLVSSDLSKLVVVEACFKETLRLHPAAAQIGRDAKHDTLLKGGYLLRRGQRVTVNLVSLHRNERYWGGRFGDPNTFNPERFMPGAAESSGRHPNAFHPFGFGVRTCVGMAFALWEAKVLLPMMYHNFTFRLVDGFKLRPSRRESFPTLSAEGLAFQIYAAPGAPSRLPAPSADLSISATAQHTSTAAAAAPPQPSTPTKSSSSAAAAVAASPVPAGVDSSNSGSNGDRHNTPLLVLYGSNSGTCEAFAAQIADSAAAAGFQSRIATLDSTLAADGPAGSSSRPRLPQKGAVVIVTSTYNGTPPDNAVRFARWLSGAAGAGGAEGVVYAVFGVGNSQWQQTYQAFPRLVDAELSAAGATRLCPLSCTDAHSGDFVDSLEAWWDTQLLPQLLERFQVTAPSGGASSASAGITVRRPRLVLTAAPQGMNSLSVVELLQQIKQTSSKAAAAVAAAAAAAARAASAAELSSNEQQQQQQEEVPVFPYEMLRITAAEQLQAARSGRFTRHVELELPKGIRYTAGDHLEVLPCNPPALVDSALSLLGLTGEEVFLWTPNTQAAARGFNLTPTPQPHAPYTPDNASDNNSSSSSSSDVVEGPDGSSVFAPMAMSSRAVLSWFVDLASIPSRSTLSALAELCPCPPEARRLQKMVQEAAYKEQVVAARLTLLEVLSSCRSLLHVLDFSAVTNLMPRLAPRYYSISSSPKAEGGPSRATITVALVEGPTPTGRLHQGPASTHIHNQQVGSFVIGAVRPYQSRFSLPADPCTPLIMVGPGTGVAPLVGFCEERQALQQAGARLGPAVLFFGCRRPDEDYLYRSRLTAWQSSGVLSQLHVAFSRLEGKPKAYVQDLITANGQQLWQLLQQGGRVFVCGDALAMAPGVRQAFVGLAHRHGGMQQQQAEHWLAGLLQEGRYLEDVWASN